MYLGMVLILISTAIKFSLYGGLLVIGFFVYFITIFQILPEEKAMQKLFERILQTIKIKLEDGFN